MMLRKLGVLGVRFTRTAGRGFRASALIILTAWGLAACAMGCPLDADAVREQLNSQLNVGDSREKIEAVLTSEGIGGSYDQWSHRYQTTIRDEERCGVLSMYKAISVYLYLDDKGRLSRIEVSESYTWW